MADKLLYGVEDLKAKANEIQTLSGEVYKTNNEIMGMIDELNGVFEGTAAARFISRSDEVIDTLNSGLKELQEVLAGIITNMSDTMSAKDLALATSVNTDIVSPITK